MKSVEQTWFRKVLSLAVLMILIGCATRHEAIRTISHEQLVEIVKPFEAGSFPASTSYQGSQNGFDYFEVQKPVVTSGSGKINVRISQADSPLSRRFLLTQDQNRWVRYCPTIRALGDELEWGDGVTNRFKSVEEQIRTRNLFELKP